MRNPARDSKQAHAGVCEVIGLVMVLAACSTSVTDPRPPSFAPTVEDPANHIVRRIEVAPEIELEVLDYGGEGSPVILLAGLGLSAHIFDDFAPRLTDRHHVYAITRRGYGGSSKPEVGYDLATRVADDLAVLAALGHHEAVWIGHSLAGDELTAIAATRASSVRMLVYLDATNDHGARLEELRDSLKLA